MSAAPHAISVLQPWAGAIIRLGKDVENRTWATRFRGRINIHASAGFDAGGLEYLMRCGHSLSPRFGRRGNVVGCDEKHFDQRSAIIGSVEIVDCVTSSDSPWFFGPYGFVMRDRRVIFDPVECRGRLGIWPVDPDVLRLLPGGAQ